MSARSPFLRLERRIASSERGGIVERWRYGRELLSARAGRKQLPHGMLADLVAAAERSGLKVSEREIQRRIKLAETYDSEAKVRQILADFGTWSALADAGFPAIEQPEAPAPVEAPDLSDEAFGGHQLILAIPGLPEEIKTRDGRTVALAEATVADAVAYRDQYREMHESFGKTLARIEASVAELLDSADGDESMTIAAAWLGDDALATS